MIEDINSFEERYRQLEAELGEGSVGEAVRRLAGLEGDEKWDNVVAYEVRRVVQLHADHYSQFEKDQPATVVIGRNPLRISDQRDELMATIGFVQGATFVVAALQEQGKLK
jgi:hypothetical protein